MYKRQLQNCAANLGGMLTPFGNPQNLYLFNHYTIPNGEFLTIMLPPFLLSTALILACCLLIPRETLTVPAQETPVDKRRCIVYGVLFCTAAAMVLRGIPYWLGLAAITAALLVLDRRALLGVDWGLLVTFAAFFTFSGNMARMEPVRTLFRQLLAHGAMPVAALTSQVISNVPAAILLSQFTDDYPALLVGVNIGGAGTLVASLASLITFREYTKHVKGQTGRFLALFSAVSFAAALNVSPISFTASMFRPALVAPMFTELQTMSVSAKARGMDSIRRLSPAEKPLCTRAV